MATSSLYYLNAPSLGSATAVFTDDELTICAPDGFYSNGSIVREQVECSLLPQQTCPSCATPCNTTTPVIEDQGVYLIDLNTGSTGGDIGAVIVRFNPYSVPDGIRATLGSTTYNKLTSSVDGLHQSSTSGNFTYVGQTSADCGISGTTYPALTEFIYDGTAFVPTGNTQSITVSAGDVSLGATAPGNCLMVIPKLTASPSVINFEVVGPCVGTTWAISIACPVMLTGFSSSVMSSTELGVCELFETVTYYNASLAETPGIVGLYDFVYADAYGSTPLNAGYYKATGSIISSNDWFQVSSAGVVIALGVCAAPPTTASLSWSYSETGGSVGSMDLYVNGSIVESRSSTASGTYAVSVGDTINAEITASACAGVDIKANAYCTGIVVDSACANVSTSLLSSVYTVVSGDLGTTLHLDTFSHCDSGCI